MTSAVGRPERYKLRGYTLAQAACKDAYTEFSPEESAFVSKWVEDVPSGLSELVRVVAAVGPFVRTFV